MSSKTIVLALVDTLSFNLADTTVTPVLFDECIQELGHDPRAWLTAVGTQNLANTNALVTLAGSLNIVRMLGLFYQDRQLRQATVGELDAFSGSWRDEVGKPVAYVVEEEKDRIVRLYPRPSQAVSGTITTDPPLSIVYTEQRTTVPDWLDLPVALLVFAREFERESNHRDIDTAAIARALGEDMLRMVA